MSSLVRSIRWLCHPRPLHIEATISPTRSPWWQKGMDWAWFPGEYRHYMGGWKKTQWRSSHTGSIPRGRQLTSKQCRDGDWIWFIMAPSLESYIASIIIIRIITTNNSNNYNNNILYWIEMESEKMCGGAQEERVCKANGEYGDWWTDIDQESTYKFLGVLKFSKKEDKLVLENTPKEYFGRLVIIWSSPLSDHSKVVATNQYALPVLSYWMGMWTWPLAQLQHVDREARRQ